ncbi:MAG: DNA-3-methyladenine glycosylase 2 family protein [Candidatus Diapherotrites archaeon]
MQKAITHLKKQDKIMAKLIEKIGTIKLTKKNNYYESLCQAIIFQQLSMKAASKIYEKFKLIHKHEIKPETTIAIGKRPLKEAGLSEKKIEYIISLAKAISENTINFKAMQKMKDEEIINELTKLKGIGPWTAQMFLIFSLGRKNVLPLTDLGFINAMQSL